MAAKTLKEKIDRVLTVWHAWSLYPQKFVESLEAIMNKGEKTSGRSQTTGTTPSLIEKTVDNLDGEAIQEKNVNLNPAVEVVEGEKLAILGGYGSDSGDNEDNEDEDVDGVAFDDLDGVPI